LNADAVFYRGFRYPAEIISHCVWLYYRFPLGVVNLSGGLIAFRPRREHLV
jgi:transposase-like protein